MTEGFTAYDSALTFEYATVVLFNSYQVGLRVMSYFDIGLCFPIIVNASFACELFLKALLNDGTRGHKLYNDLFAKLERIDYDTAELIKQYVIKLMHNIGQTDYNADKFIEELKWHEQCFETERYWHESNKNRKSYTNINFLIGLMEILKGANEMKYGKRPLQK